MPVELTILSGARAGEAIQLDLDAFRVGDDPAAEIAFDPRHDPAGRGRLALVMREEAGWRIQNQGSGPLLVNHTVVDGRVPLRSGDIIRLLDMGPDVRFSLVSAARTGAPSRAAPAESNPAMRESDRAQTGGSDTALPGGVPLRRWAIAAAALGLLAAAVIGLRLLPRTPNEPAPAVTFSPPRPPPLAPAPIVGADAVPATPVRKAEDDQAAPQDSATNLPPPQNTAGNSPTAPGPDSSPPAAPVSKPVPPVTVPPTDPWESVAAVVAPAVCLLMAETPDKSKSFPCGTACTIREDALLTNGMLAAELQGKRLKDWQVKAVWPSDGQELPVREILVHKVFNATADAPGERIYWELAILRLDGKRAAVVPLAEPKELAEIESGLPLACACVPHRGLPRTRFDHPRVEQSVTEVYLQTRLAAAEGAPPSGAPALLHLTGTLPQNIYGSPLVNAAGHVVGVYAEKAAPSGADAAAGLELHYAPLVTLARAFLAGQGLDDWTQPECPHNQTPTPSPP